MIFLNVLWMASCLLRNRLDAIIDTIAERGSDKEYAIAALGLDCHSEMSTVCEPTTDFAPVEEPPTTEADSDEEDSDEEDYQEVPVEEPIDLHWAEQLYRDQLREQCNWNDDKSS